MSFNIPPCSRRRFFLGTVATVADTFVVACAPKLEIEKVDAANVPIGDGVIIGNYVVTQPEEGKFAAFPSSCPHQNNHISEVSNSVMACSNHNSQFDIATGEVVAGPLHKPTGRAPLLTEGTELIVGQKQVLEADQ